MKDARVEISATSRLHFGMFSFGHEQQRAFGGVGAMVDKPGVRIRVAPASSLEASGPHAARALAFAKRWATRTERTGAPPCRIETLAAPPQHVGLGVGTQLGLAVAKGLDVLFDGGERTAAELAALVGRGERSAVGVHGFGSGGLIVERGKQPHENLSPLVAAYPIPPAWRFVLVRPQVDEGLHGRAERAAFASLPSVPEHVTRRLWREVDDAMLPALKAEEFERFSESVYRFGRTAGECFGAVQGGPYNGKILSELVAAIRRMGIVGVGQSSWGPTLYCLLPEFAAAEVFVGRMQRQFGSLSAVYTISSPCNRGARVYGGAHVFAPAQGNSH